MRYFVVAYHLPSGTPRYYRSYQVGPRGGGGSVARNQIEHLCKRLGPDYRWQEEDPAAFIVDDGIILKKASAAA